MTSLHVVKTRNKKKIQKPIAMKDFNENRIEGENGKLLDTQHLLISMLIPPAVKAFFEELEKEVTSLTGSRYARESEVSRYGTQNGSIVLGNQRISIKKPRIRSIFAEKKLETYEKFQDKSLFDEAVFQQGIKHVSQRDYEKGLPKIAASFGLSRSSVSRSWIKSTEKQLKMLLDRDLKPFDITAVFIDGKRFSRLGTVIALGVGSDGRKHVLGIYESSTESSAACKALLDDLERRGLSDREVLFIVDGGSGLNKALNEKYDLGDETKKRAHRVRCFIHKWRNIEAVLDEKGKQAIAPLYWAIRDAADLTEAKFCSGQLEASLKRHNESALRSYLEAKDDLMAIHSLKIGRELKKFFSSTNAIESLNYLLEEDLRRVKNWKNSNHFQRWLATSCLANEKRMRKIKGYRGLPALKVRLRELCNQNTAVDNETAAA